MHCSRVEDGVVDAFVELGTLIVEGRLPAEGTDRGYNEGPHCPRTAAHALLHDHQCDPNDFLCIRAERLRKHMLLLCTNAVPMCVEVLLCPVCQCGTERAKNPEIANIPSNSDHLLEQWTVSVVHVSGEPCNMTVRGLFQAVRSQLHFSQLSAWWSSSKGTQPVNVCYRITLPGEAFASQFSRPPSNHVFPPAAVGPNTQLKVSVRILPRSESLPVVKCSTCTPEASMRKRSIGLEQPLLGESLLDPPGPSSSRAHAGLCKWHTSSPPSPPRRRPSRPVIVRRCDKHSVAPIHIVPLPGPVDDRMQTNCNQHGKHDCRCEEDVEEMSPPKQKHTEADANKINLDLSKKEMEEVLTVLRVRAGEGENIENITTQGEKETGKGDLLLSAILRSSQANTHTNTTPTFVRKLNPNTINTPDSKTTCDTTISYSKKYPQHLEVAHCDKGKENQALSFNILEHKTQDRNLFSLPESKVLAKLSDSKVDPACMRKQMDHDQSSLISNNPQEVKNITSPENINNCLSSAFDRLWSQKFWKNDNVNKCQEENKSVSAEGPKSLDLNKRLEPCSGRGVPTALDKAKFRRSLDSAASMVFHYRTGLPLTSSPAPLRRSSQCFDYDSSINSVSAIRSALFDSESGDETESEGSSKSPCSPQIDTLMKKELWTTNYQSPSSALLGSFEESVLNGRLEPVSTVQGFTADLGASGSFCPPHLVLPVTVFFYTLGDNDKVSSPYLAHINLGKKGYVVPRCGTIQVTLLNPLGTVIKMFVVMYNLTDIPNNSHTFLRQRTLYMPANTSEPLENSQKYLRYLIHLRFASSKSGRLSLHTDIRMVIFRKSDMDTATGHGADKAYELRSFTNGPTNPKFSPRK